MKQFRGFFSFGAAHLEPVDRTTLRDRWEYSHVARAALAALSFVLLITAAVVAR